MSVTSFEPTSARKPWFEERPHNTPAASRSRKVVTNQRGRGAGLHAGLLIAAALYSLPLIWVTWKTFVPSDPGRVSPTLDNLRELNARMPVVRLFANTVIATLGRVAGQVTLCVAAGFAFAQLRFRFRSTLLVALLTSAMLPPALYLVPLLILTRVAGMVNTFPGLIVPTLVSGFGVLLFTQTFRTIPQDLTDAARVDGCHLGQVIRHVALPYARTTIAAFALLVTIYSWNEYIWSLTVTIGPERRVLSVGTALLSNQYGRVDEGLQMAASFVTAAPVVIGALAARRWLHLGLLHPDSGRRSSQ